MSLVMYVSLSLLGGGVSLLHSTVTYALDVSERLGRSSSKEQYAYMYR